MTLLLWICKIEFGPVHCAFQNYHENVKLSQTTGWCVTVLVAKTLSVIGYCAGKAKGLSPVLYNFIWRGKENDSVWGLHETRGHWFFLNVFFFLKCTACCSNDGFATGIHFQGFRKNNCLFWFCPNCGWRIRLKIMNMVINGKQCWTKYWTVVVNRCGLTQNSL